MLKLTKDLLVKTLSAHKMSEAWHVCVVGAGAVGLSAAVQLQEMLGNKGKVSIIAEKFGKETTSDGAAGMFNPRVDVTKSVPENLCSQWLVRKLL